MKHRKRSAKLNRTVAHRRAMIANMLKALIEHETLTTTVAKAKELRRHADKMITLAKRNTLATRRRAIAELMVRFNPLTAKEARQAREGDTSAYNGDRKVVDKLFAELGPRFETRQGGYTRIVKVGNRTGDNAETCIIEYLSQ